MADCCTNKGSKVQTYFNWKIATTATWETIRTPRGQFASKQFFYKAYDWVIEKSKSKLDAVETETFKAEVCAMQTMIGKLLKHANVDAAKNPDNAATNQNKIEGVWKREIDKLCKNLDKNIESKKTKSCKAELGTTAYNTLKASCESDEVVKRRRGKCKCVKETGTVVKGCMDKSYKEYDKDATEDTSPTSCKTLKKPKKIWGCMDDGDNLPDNVTVTNYNPDATANAGCKYSTPIVVKNNYMFCTDDTDGTFNGCDPAEAKVIMDGYITPKTYKVIADTASRVNNIRAMILNIVTQSIESGGDISYIPIRNENKFTKAFNQSLIGDITNALTVSVVETQFKRSEDDPEFQVYPFTYFTAYSPQGATDPITEFKIKRNTAIDAPIGITSISPVDSTNTFKKRLANIQGVPTVPPNFVNRINKILVSNLKISDIKFNNEGILQENRIPNVGLGKVLYKEPIGLEKLIK